MNNTFRRALLATIATAATTMTLGCRSTSEDDASQLESTTNNRYLCSSKQLGISFQFTKPLLKSSHTAGEKVSVKTPPNTFSRTTQFEVTRFSRTETDAVMAIEPADQNNIGETFVLRWNTALAGGAFDVEYNHGKHRNESSDGVCTTK